MQWYLNVALHRMESVSDSTSWLSWCSWVLRLHFLPSPLAWAPLLCWIWKNKLRVRVNSTDSAGFFGGGAAELVFVCLNNVHITAGKQSQPTFWFSFIED